MKINKPKISYLEDKDFIEQYKLEEYNNCRFTSNIDEDITISNVTFDSCIFSNIDFSKISFNNKKHFQYQYNYVYRY